ncbi:MAG TPA: glycosyltransferase family 4 protein [Terriglobales bacterium]|nr:glycosyltransferase family 4 protein [Terriglobales bacterium]
MHILVTTDTITGVWTYTRELVTSLVTSGIRVTLVSFGEIPLPEQTTWMDHLHGLDYHPTAFRLEWMQEAERDLSESCHYVEWLIRELRPDILHSNQYCYGAVQAGIPRIVIAHGDVISWWLAVHGHQPPKTAWLEWYQSIVGRGLAAADAVVSPSRWMGETLRACYVPSRHERVIHNGRNPIFFNPYVSKEDTVLAVGRLWDAGKQVSLLTQHPHEMPVCIVGAESPWYIPRAPIRADVKLALDKVSVSFKGPQTEAQLRTLYSRASIYAATSRYEPFGMSPLEAALSRCAIVANDIPTYREIWDDTAVYFERNNAESLAENIRMLSEDRELCRAYGNLAYQRARERFTAKRMLDEYLQLYRSLLRKTIAA